MEWETPHDFRLAHLYRLLRTQVCQTSDARRTQKTEEARGWHWQRNCNLSLYNDRRCNKL